MQHAAQAQHSLNICSLQPVHVTECKQCHQNCAQMRQPRWPVAYVWHVHSYIRDMESVPTDGTARKPPVVQSVQPCSPKLPTANHFAMHVFARLRYEQISSSLLYVLLAHLQNLAMWAMTTTVFMGQMLLVATFSSTLPPYTAPRTVMTAVPAVWVV